MRMCETKGIVASRYVTLTLLKYVYENQPHNSVSSSSGVMDWAAVESGLSPPKHMTLLHLH